MESLVLEAVVMRRKEGAMLRELLQRVIELVDRRYRSSCSMAGVLDERARRVPLLVEPIRKVPRARVLDPFGDLLGNRTPLSRVEHAPTVTDAMLVQHTRPAQSHESPRKLVLCTQLRDYAERQRQVVAGLRPSIDRIVVCGIAGNVARGLHDVAGDHP